jgi:aminopeptidase N
LNPNIASLVYCYGIAEGGVKEWNHAFTAFLNSNSGTEKEALLLALGCSKKPWILQR